MAGSGASSSILLPPGHASVMRGAKLIMSTDECTLAPVGVAQVVMGLESERRVSQ